MINQQQSICDQIDYDVPPSTCGYPIYFSLCVDGQFDRSINRPINSSLSQQHSQIVNSQNINNNYCNDIHRYNTLPASIKGYDEINGCRDQNIVIPDRDFNFNQLLRLSEQPKLSSSEQIYDVPRPIQSNGKNLSDNVYPAQLVITTTNNYDSLPPTPPPLSVDKRLGIQNLRQLPRSGSHDFSRCSLPRINCNTSLPLPLNTKPPISNFGSTSSLPSPISSLESSSISFSSGENNNKTSSTNRLSLGNQSTGESSETYDVPPVTRETGTKNQLSTGSDVGCCSNCGTLTLPKSSSSGFQGKTGYNNTLIDDKNYDKPPSSYLINNNQFIYDVPKNTSGRNNYNHDRCTTSTSQRPVKAMTAITRSYNNNNSLSSSSSSLSSNHHDNNYNIDSDGLDLNLESGLKLASRLESESLEAIGKLIEMSSLEGWRKEENLENKLTKLTKLSSQLKCVIREVEVFTDGIYINSLKINSSINSKLYRLSRQLKDSANIVISTIRSIDLRGWNLNELSISNQGELRKISHDELDQLIACMPGLKEDIKHIMSLVKSYGNLLFPVEKQIEKQQPTINKSNSCLLNTIGSVPSSTSKSTFGSVKSLPSKPPPPPVPPKPPINLRPLPLVPKDNLSSESTINYIDLNLGKITLNEKESRTTKENEDKRENILENDDDEDGDYASLEIKDKIRIENSSDSDKLSTLNSPEISFNQDDEVSIFINTQKATTMDKKQIGDKNFTTDQLLSFYCPLLEEYNQNLRNSVNNLISAINNKQTPDVLVNLSKLVVIAGQQMISVGQTINHHVCGNINFYISICSNELCQSLKNLLSNMKRAVITYPSTSTLQDLLDSIVQVSVHSDKLTHIKEQYKQ